MILQTRYLLIITALLATYSLTGQIIPTSKKNKPDFNPDTILHPFVNGRQLVEITFKEAWKREADWRDGYQPRAMPPGFGMAKPKPDIYLVREQQGKIIKAYNSEKTLEEINRDFKNIPTDPSNNRIGMYPYSQYIPRLRYTYYDQYSQLERMIPGYYRVYSQSPDLLQWNDKNNVYKAGLIDTLGNLVFPISYELIEAAGKNFLIKKDGRFGIIDINKNIIVAVEYDDVIQPDADKFVFSRNKKTSLIYNSNSNQIKKLNNYDWIDSDRLNDIERATKDEGPLLVMVRKNGLSGFINKQQEEIVAPVYDYAKPYFRNGLVPVCRNKKWGYLNAKGVEAIPCQYEDAIDFYEGKAVVVENGVSKCIDTYGNPADGCNMAYSKWESKFELSDKSTFIKCRRIINRSHQYGVVNETGQIIIPIVYENLTGVQINSNKTTWSQEFYKARLHRKMGIISKDGEIILPFEYDNIFDFNAGLNLAVVEKDGKYGLVDLSFKWVIPCRYESLSPYQVRNKILFREGNLWGWMDMNERVEVEPQFDHVGWNEDGKVHIIKNKMHGFIDTAGKTIIPAKYKALASKFYHGWVLAQEGKKWGFLDSTAKTVIPFQYDDARNFEYDITAVQKGKKFGFINRNNEEVVPFIYDFVDYSWAHDKLVKVVRKGKLGYVDQQGKEVIPCIYDDENGYRPGLGHSMKKDGTWSYVKAP